MRHFFVYNGIRSDDRGLVLADRPTCQLSKRLQDTVTVPGRNGTMKLSTGAFDNVTRRYSAWFRGGSEMAHALAEWLIPDAGYFRLMDSGDSAHYRLASYAGGMDIAALGCGADYGKCEIAFDCKPQAFLLSGETSIQLVSSGVVYNPTRFVALPVLRVYGTGTVSVNGTVCTINSSDGYTDLDCETMQAHKGAVSCNANVEIDPYPTLAPGENSIGIVGPSKVEITPRWWTL